MSIARMVSIKMKDEYDIWLESAPFPVIAKIYAKEQELQELITFSNLYSENPMVVCSLSLLKKMFDKEKSSRLQ